MGNCFPGCTKRKESDSSSGGKKGVEGKQKAKRSKGNSTIDAFVTKSPSLTPKDDLTITSVASFNDDVSDVATKSKFLGEGSQPSGNLTVAGPALPILEKTESPGTEHDVSNTNAKIIVVQPSLTSENSSKENFPEEGVKRPITGSESSASLTPSSAVEETRCDDDLEELELGHDEKTSSTLPEPCGSVSPEIPGRRSHFKLLEFLKIRLDMAANNMEINRLLANVDRSLDRTSRTRELGFRRMREAQESLRAAQDMRKTEETRQAAQDIQEETYTDEEEAESEEAEEGDDGVDSPSPPPPIPRICWQ